MHLTEEEITKFQEITMKLKGVWLTRAEALDQGLRLVQLYELMGQNGSCILDPKRSKNNITN